MRQLVHYQMASIRQYGTSTNAYNIDISIVWQYGSPAVDVRSENKSIITWRQHGSTAPLKMAIAMILV